ncbi:MAG: HAD family phosphatase [Kiritimatiellales bacterium]
MNRFSGVIFDFNGTLFWDTALHNQAWDIFLRQHNVSLSDDEKFRTLHGKNNQDILTGLFGSGLPPEKERAFILEKETFYQQLCLQARLTLAPGAEDFLDFLKKAGIPFTIATASGEENIRFYFKHLPLTRWFAPDSIVYNDGTIKGKPYPDIYRRAMQLIGCRPEETVVFEDAPSGLQAAANADAGKIIIVDSNNFTYSGWEKYSMIRDFSAVDRSLFHRKTPAEPAADLRLRQGS